MTYIHVFFVLFFTANNQNTVLLLIKIWHGNTTHLEFYHCLLWNSNCFNPIHWLLLLVIILPAAAEMVHIFLLAYPEASLFHMFVYQVVVVFCMETMAHSQVLTSPAPILTVHTVNGASGHPEVVWWPSPLPRSVLMTLEIARTTS